ncbi:hypothetical protein [uncultured Pseudoteredinibacter sp.]|uniref:hypothetical protein n=1 Tax=uncultured Pseudoteredinibacter sp. TaxID=1641701 RepID=UPI00262AE14B|nr:hypothetical protein [uncultured Pseudoteredinibacter sp.]
MEYLEIRGAVELKPEINKPLVRAILSRLAKTRFSDDGKLRITLRQRKLSIEAEGTLSDSHTLRSLFTALQPQLSEHSMIGISRIRWETLIVLRLSQSLSQLELIPQSA